MARDGLGSALFSLRTSAKPLILDLSKVTFADDTSIRILTNAYASLSETHSVTFHFAPDGQAWLSKQFAQARR